MASLLQLQLSNGQSLQMRVEDADAELEDLKARQGRYAGEYVALTGPAVGIVRTDAIVAVLLR
jgi:hypothetical protein